MTHARNVGAALIGSAVFAVGCSKSGSLGFEGQLTMHEVRSGQAPRDTVVQVKANKMRYATTSPSGVGLVDIWDAHASSLLVLRPDEKSYRVSDHSRTSPSAAWLAGQNTAVNTGRREAVLGLECEIWTTGDPKGAHSQACLLPGLPYMNLDSLPGVDLQRRRLFPLRVVVLDGAGHEMSRLEVTNAKRQALDDALFVVPDGYKEVADLGDGPHIDFQF